MFSKKFLLLFIAPLFVSSSAFSSREFEDILPHDYESQQNFLSERGFESFPIRASFYNSEREENLRYVAAKHSFGRPEDGDQSPTFDLIQEAFQNYNPDFLIVEGFDKSFLMTQRVANDCQYPTESMYAVRQAIEHNVPFVGGEPEQREILNALVAQGYSSEDLFVKDVFSFVSSVNEKLREALKDENNLSKAINLVPNNEGFDASTFESWCIKNYGTRLDFESILLIGKNVTVEDPLKRIKDAVLRVRDEEILTRIIESEEKYKRVLIVYGSSHYYVQYLELEKYFGTPEYSV
ncbi:MAG: hypothetical protein GY915_05355 [bacterium]|nr:hypothetical protein [bacterium]